MKINIPYAHCSITERPRQKIFVKLIARNERYKQHEHTRLYGKHWKSNYAIEHHQWNVKIQRSEG
jgi:hypothetical protein